MITGSEKLKLVRELGVIRKSFPEAGGRNKLVLAKRIGEIRKLLISVQDNKSVGLVIDISNELSSLQAIDSYFSNGFTKLPDALQLSEIQTINEIWAMIPAGEENITYRSKVQEKILASWVPGEEGKERSKIAAMEHYKSIGSAFDVDSERLKSILDLAKEWQEKEIQHTPEMESVLSRCDELTREVNETREKRTALYGSIHGVDEELLAELNRRHSELWNQINSLSGDYRNMYADLQAEQNAKVDAIKAEITPVGRNVIATLINSSKISQDQADNWAAKQTITKSAENRLKKLGYPIADVRRDMAEFYRITGGKVRDIGLDSSGKRRANSGAIESYEGNIMQMGSRFNKTVLFHELAHHLESDLNAKAASNGFLLKRRKSADKYRLRQLTGNSGYSNDEYAYSDEFINHYIGKVYPRGTTEVWSMGVQYLSNPDDAAMLMARDPEMAALIFGYLQSDMTPGAEALKLIKDYKKVGAMAERESRKSAYEEAIDFLGQGVDIEDDGWFNALDDDEKFAILGDSFNYSRIGDKDAKYLGSWGFFRIFTGKFRNQSRRMAKGYSVCYENRWNLKDTSVDYQKIVPPYFVAFHGDIKSLKAALKIAKESFGGEIYQVVWRMFYKNSYEGDIIREANKLRSAQ